MFQLKPLSTSAIPNALTKAERYRLLNEPEQCQSICEDILRCDPGNHEATLMLVLAITDSFPTETRPAGRDRACVGNARPHGFANPNRPPRRLEGGEDSCGEM